MGVWWNGPSRITWNCFPGHILLLLAENELQFASTLTPSFVGSDSDVGCLVQIQAPSIPLSLWVKEVCQVVGTFRHNDSITVFSCEDTAQQVLMSVCLCVCVSESQSDFGLFQTVLECSGLFQNVPECSILFQTVPDCSRLFHTVPYRLPQQILAVFFSML